MNDYLSLLPSTFQWVSESLGRITVVPWPLWLGLLFPIYAAGIIVFLWVMRGGFWPVRCIYPKTSKKWPCENWVPGEWYRCRYHNYRASYNFGHTVDTDIKRWQQVDRSGELVDSAAQGVGVLKTRPAGRALLYQNGYARKPWDVARIVPEFARKTYDRLRGASVRRRAAVAARPEDLWKRKNDVADGLPEVVRATRAALTAFAVGLAFTGVSILFEGPWQAAFQWLATLTLVVAWAAVNAGIYDRADDWIRRACVKALKWWAYIFAPVAIANLVFAAIN